VLLRQLLPPSDQEVGLLLAGLAAGLKRPPGLLRLVDVLGHLRERDFEAQLHFVGIGAATVAAGALFGEELRFGRDHRQAVVLLGMGDLAPQLQVAAEIQGAAGLLQVRLGTLGPAFSGEVGRFLKLLFAIGQPVAPAPDTLDLPVWRRYYYCVARQVAGSARDLLNERYNVPRQHTHRLRTLLSR
jgi:hypothetical protein